MQCRRCGKDLGDALKCNFCGYENTVGNIRELTRTEKHFFGGETIDIGDSDGRSNEQREENFRGQNFYGTRRTFVHVGSSGNGFFSRAVNWLFREVMGGNRLVQVALTLILVALAVMFFFVALPIIFVVLAVGILLLTLVSKFK